MRSRTGSRSLARLLGIAVGEQLHRALEVGEEDRDLLALAFEGGLGGEDLLGEVLRCMARRKSALRVCGGASHRHATTATEFFATLIYETAGRNLRANENPALPAQAAALPVPYRQRGHACRGPRQSGRELSDRWRA